MNLANAFQGSRPPVRQPAQTPTSKPQSVQKTGEVENLMTLKQACSSEYQGAQGAFKDSMIH